MKNKGSVVLLIIGGILAISLTNCLADGAGGGPVVTAASVSVQIDNSYAVTRVREIIDNPSDGSCSATFNFQVPGEAFISNFSLRIDGKDHFGKVIGAAAAQERYDAAVSRGQNAGLLAARGKSLFSYSVNLKPHQNVTVGLVFEQFLRMKGGEYSYSLPLDGNTFGGATPVLEIACSISYSSEITGVRALNYTDTYIERWHDQARTHYGVAAFQAAGSYEICYGVAGSATVISPFHDGKDTYFIHSFRPGTDEIGGGALPKQIVFVLDRSGSMSGDKIAQVKDAFGGILRQLGPEDEFNVVYFNHGISEWKSSLVGATQANIDAAAGFIREVSAGGSTDFNGALVKALGDIKARELAAPIVVMLTDGQPTSGQTNKAQIRQNARNSNTMNAPIYCLGFGNDLDFEFLRALSLESGARALRIYLGRDGADQIKDFYSTISDPLMKRLSFGYCPAAETYVLGGSYLYDGSELVVVGKVPGHVRLLTVSSQGVSRNGQCGFNTTVDLDALPASSMAARFWAFARISHMLDRITVEGQGSPLVTEVTNMSVEAGFVTPYTSMLIEVGEQSSTDQPPAQKFVGESARPKAAGARMTPYGTELMPLAIIAALVALALRRRMG